MRNLRALRIARRRARRGMTLLEISISTAVVGFLVFAAATVTKLTIDTTSDVVVDDVAQGQERRSDTTFDDLLLPASQSQLQGVPTTGQVVENLLDDVSYQELRFRRVTGFRNGAVVYEPAAGTTAARLYRSVDKSGTGSLVLESGGRTSTLVASVSSVVFSKSGSKLTVTLSYGRDESETDVHELVLRVP